MRLPDGLASWAEPLDALTPRLATALGPMVRRLDALLAVADPGPAPAGEFAGYGGIARRGHPERLLASEWLYAQELGTEFLRRAADGELLYLDHDFVDPIPTGRVLVLVDAGPLQAGAPRLVHLACLIVLARKAQARGTQLVVDVIGTDPHVRLTGDLRRVLRSWLNFRLDQVPTRAQVAAHLAAADDADEVWILGTDGAGGRVVTARETGWTAAGASRVEVSIADTTVELPLPAPEMAIAALRGREFAVIESTAAGGTAPVGPLRLPAFTGRPRQLLMRGEGPGHLLSLYIPTEGRPPARPTRHTFRGTAYAASWVRRRLIVLTLTRGEFAVHVIGRPAPELVGIGGPVDGFGPEAIALSDDAPIRPIHHVADALICRIGEAWWRLRADEPPVRIDLASIVPGVGRESNEPLLTIPAGGRNLRFTGWPQPITAVGVTDHVLGGGAFAWRAEDPTAWRIRIAPKVPEQCLHLPADVRAIGLVVEDGRAALISTSAHDSLVRTHTPDGDRVLRAWSDAPDPVTVHPTLPLIAGRDREGRIRVGHAVTGALLATLATA
ncbi:hypothetical protein [Embleya scabrispora]|uniref:hypothetical protein n=1 Tax=Embleya scabrispora TaxID=159449 RepID=UPI00036913BE|nr:hypothetical protein [Embleya scabrispora]MYS82694.1 hypothetical protein [Streptomyces sp. SID5474]